MMRSEINAKLTNLLRAANDAGIVAGPYNAEVLKALENLGMVPKRDLRDGAYYYGICRNARVARWDACSGTFWYMRHKFGQVFKESIRHPADDDGYDLFISVGECEPEEQEMVS